MCAFAEVPAKTVCELGFLGHGDSYVGDSALRFVGTVNFVHANAHFVQSSGGFLPSPLLCDCDLFEQGGVGCREACHAGVQRRIQ